VNESFTDRFPVLQQLYRRFLDNEDSAGFIKNVALRYTVPTLERLAERGDKVTRRAALLALGFLAGYESNAVMGRALRDSDRASRMIAENSIRSLWCRSGEEHHRQQLSRVIRLNASHEYEAAVRHATLLLREAPNFAEAWNQRAVAYFQLGDFKESIGDCHQALEINPYHFGAASGMGQCYIHLGHPHSALESFQRALNLNPSLENIRMQVLKLQRVIEEEEEA